MRKRERVYTTVTDFSHALDIKSVLPAACATPHWKRSPPPRGENLAGGLPQAVNHAQAGTLAGGAWKSISITNSCSVTCNQGGRRGFAAWACVCGGATPRRRAVSRPHSAVAILVDERQHGGDLLVVNAGLSRLDCPREVLHLDRARTLRVEIAEGLGELASGRGPTHGQTRG